MLRAGVAVVVLMTACTVAYSYGSSGSLSVMVYQDGLAHVSAQFDVDPLDPVFELDLLGLEVDNFVATDGDRALLSVEFLEGVAILETFDSETVVAEYDVHDLVSKEGRIWTFTLNAAQDYALIMPRNAVIIGMNTIPLSLEVVGREDRAGDSRWPSRDRLHTEPGQDHGSGGRGRRGWCDG